MPKWTPFSAGEAFAHTNAAWIQQELRRQAKPPLESGQKIGKLHYLRFEHMLSGQAPTSRVTGTEVVVHMQPGETIDSPSVQERAHKATLRALKREAEQLLPPRLQGLAIKYNRTYSSVSVKQLKRRWGSCDSHQAITLNFFLMELPWEYIDYVLLHELTHTVHMNHGPEFWKTLISMESSARNLSKQLRSHQPLVGTWQAL